MKRRLEYFAMFLLSTPIVLRSALFQSLDQIFREIANHELCHWVSNNAPLLAMLALPHPGCKQC